MLGPQYVAVQVTLTAANTNYSVYDLVAAIESNCPAVCRQLTVQAATGNTDPILVGDGSLSATRFGYELSRLESKSYDNSGSRVPVNTKFVRSAGAGQKLNVEIEV